MGEGGSAPVGRFARAERATRRTTWVLGAGLIAYVAGSLTSTAIVAAAAEPFDDLGSTTAARVLASMLQSWWVLAFLPPLGWLAGRFIEVKAWSFALTAVASGVFFDVMLRSATVGLEWVIIDSLDGSIQLGCLVLGTRVTAWMVNKGQSAFEARQASAKANEVQGQAAYQAYASAKAELEPPPPHGGDDQKP